MGTELTPQQAFQEKILDRMREDIGDMMPKEALAEMIQQAAQKVFFEPRVDNSGYHTKTLPSWFEVEVGKLLTAEVTKAVQDYIEKDRANLERTVKSVLSDTLPDILSKIITSGVSGLGYTVGSQIGMTINDSITSQMNQNANRGY